MSNVVSLDDRRPHMTGEACCMACKHRYQAVAPIGVAWMECPECHLFQSTWANQVIKDGDHLHCACGNYTFHISEIYQIYCAFCGLHQGERVAL